MDGSSDPLKEKGDQPMDTSDEGHPDEKVYACLTLSRVGNPSVETIQSSLQENSDSKRNINATKLNNYYESLRTNVMSILGHAAGAAGGSSAAAAGPMASLAAASAGGLSSDSLGAAAGHHSETAFDSYLSKLQTICTDNGMETSSAAAAGLHGHHGHHDSSAGSSNPGLLGSGGMSGAGVPGPSGAPGSMKSALQNFNSLSSRI